MDITDFFAGSYKKGYNRYDEEYADTFGKFRLERIQAVGEHFITCGDYL